MVYHILIVDDESAIKRGLKQLIQKIVPNCVIDATASDGLEAIEIINQCHPDIVITDIKMPGCNGLELSRYLYENYPEIKIIMLTGFADFAYAQTAINYRVCEFLLKPTSKDKLFEAIAKAQKEIRERREQSGMLKQNTVLFREKILQEIVAGAHPDDFGDVYRKYFPHNIEHYFCIAFKSKSTMSKSKNKLTLVRSILEQQLEDQFIFRYGDTINCLYLISSPVNVACEKVKLFTEDVVKLCQSLYDVPVVAGISSLKLTLVSLPSANSEALDALLSTFFGAQPICYYTSLPERNNLPQPDYRKNLYALEKYIEHQEYDSARRIISQLFNAFPSQNISPAYVRYISGQISYILYRAAIRDELNGIESCTMATIDSSSTANELENLLLSILSDIEHGAARSRKNMNHIIKRTLQYIDCHLSEDISLEAISEVVNTSPSYLSRVFKKECGETLTEYTTRRRIESAKELLLQPDQLVYQVSELVGFNDPTYFSTIFKKYTGVTPKEYKNQIKKQTKEIAGN